MLFQITAGGGANSGSLVFEYPRAFKIGIVVGQKAGEAAAVWSGTSDLTLTWTTTEGVSAPLPTITPAQGVGGAGGVFWDELCGPGTLTVSCLNPTATDHFWVSAYFVGM